MITVDQTAPDSPNCDEMNEVCVNHLKIEDIDLPFHKHLFTSCK